jgi:hypothetical protein
MSTYSNTSYLQNIPGLKIQFIYRRSTFEIEARRKSIIDSCVCVESIHGKVNLLAMKAHAWMNLASM